jgi:hypothetical protein
MQKSNRGGKRPNAGAKTIDPNGGKRQTLAVTISESTSIKLTKLSQERKMSRGLLIDEMVSKEAIADLQFFIS